MLQTFLDISFLIILILLIAFSKSWLINIFPRVFLLLLSGLVTVKKRKSLNKHYLITWTSVNFNSFTSYNKTIQGRQSKSMSPGQFVKKYSNKIKVLNNRLDSLFIQKIVWSYIYPVMLVFFIYIFSIYIFFIYVFSIYFSPVYALTSIYIDFTIFIFHYIYILFLYISPLCLTIWSIVYSIVYFTTYFTIYYTRYSNLYSTIYSIR